MTRSTITTCAWIVTGLWTAGITTSAVWIARQVWTRTQNLALGQARADLNEERAVNVWAANIGPIYAPENKRFKPSALLSSRPERDIQTPSGKPLTMISPHLLLAHNDPAVTEGAIQHRLVSLTPVDPLKGPDSWERAALLAFKEGEGEYSEFTTADGRPVLRLMQSLITNKRCLACHGQQGYKFGDIRGGLEAWTDLTTYHQTAKSEIVALCSVHGAFWLLGTVGIALATQHARRSLTGRSRAEQERRQLDERVQQAQKLESLGVLAGGLAHDFNNLLTGVLGHSSLALAELSAESPARGLVEKAQRAALRAADLTKQMLAYSGKAPLVVEPIDLNQVVTEMTELLAVSLSKKAALKCHLADELPPIRADAAHIRQVIMNLVTNASEALGDQSGTISITTGCIECDRKCLEDTWLEEELPAGTYVHLDVADTGCGMDGETLRRIFDPFFSTKFTGRGLGLAAVLGIVRRHHGAIKVQSEPGIGTSFRVLFPKAEAALAVRKAPHPAAAPSGRAATVLVVDDEPEVLEVASMSLKQLGFDVLTARDGQEAVDTFREHAPSIDAVLLDLTMPQLNGEEVFCELHRLRPEVPVLLASGYSEADVSDRLVSRGYAGFIQKPFLPDALVEKVRTALGGPD